VSLAVLPFCNDSRGLIFLMACLALFAVSSSIYRAPTFGLISLNASSAEQGEIMGVTQSIGSMARIIGPVFALSLMDLKLELPYLICALIAIIASVLALLLIIPPSKEATESVVVSEQEDDKNSGNSSQEDDPKNKAPVRIPLQEKEEAEPEPTPNPIRVQLPTKTESGDDQPSAS